jgi:hypothetical protein
VNARNAAQLVVSPVERAPPDPPLQLTGGSLPSLSRPPLNGSTVRFRT